MTSTSLTLRCIGRRADTHDVVSWQFAPLAGSLPPVLAGQCVTLHTEIDGQPMCRAYTLSSSPQDACWQVTIKDVGRVSHHLHQSLQVGDEIRVDGPFGDFSDAEGFKAQARRAAAWARLNGPRTCAGLLASLGMR